MITVVDHILIYTYIVCPAKELTDSAHPPAPPCYRNRFPYSKMKFGDAQKTRFSSARGAFSHWTEYRLSI